MSQTPAFLEVEVDRGGIATALKILQIRYNEVSAHEASGHWVRLYCTRASSLPTQISSAGPGSRGIVDVLLGRLGLHIWATGECAGTADAQVGL